MIRDRGIIKWNGFFMPEQNEMMRKLHAEDKVVAKPEVDPYLLAEMEERINYSMEFRRTVHIRMWADGLEDVVIGEVHHVDMQRKCYVVDTDSGWRRVGFGDVVGVEVEE